MRTIRFCVAALSGLVATALFAQPVLAQTSAIDFATFSLNGTAITSTRGFIFDITAPVTVTGLSVFDAGADGLADSHDVGIWDSSGTLLASATVPAGVAAPLDSSGKFRFVPLSSLLTLSVGTGYRVGGVMRVGTPDDQFVNQTGLTSAPGISYVGEAFINNGINSLTFPSSNLGLGGLSGGSFVVGSAAPEPGSLALLGFAALPVAGLIARRRR